MKKARAKWYCRYCGEDMPKKSTQRFCGRRDGDLCDAKPRGPSKKRTKSLTDEEKLVLLIGLALAKPTRDEVLAIATLLFRWKKPQLASAMREILARHKEFIDSDRVMGVRPDTRLYDFITKKESHGKANVSSGDDGVRRRGARRKGHRSSR